MRLFKNQLLNILFFYNIYVSALVGEASQQNNLVLNAHIKPCGAIPYHHEEENNRCQLSRRR